MQLTRGSEAGYDKGDEDRFSGDVWLRAGPPAVDGMSVAVVQFAPGARTRWHRHPGGQFLFGVSGRGRVRSRGETAHSMNPGDIAYVSPDEWHFHGAEPDNPLVHFAVNGAGDPEWGDPVTEEEFSQQA